jgi:hypothetical protein
MLHYNFLISNGNSNFTGNKHCQHRKWLITLWSHPMVILWREQMDFHLPHSVSNFLRALSVAEGSLMIRAQVRDNVACPYFNRPDHNRLYTISGRHLTWLKMHWLRAIHILQRVIPRRRDHKRPTDWNLRRIGPAKMDWDQSGGLQCCQSLGSTK